MSIPYWMSLVLDCDICGCHWAGVAPIGATEAECPTCGHMNPIPGAFDAIEEQEAALVAAPPGPRINPADPPLCHICGEDVTSYPICCPVCDRPVCGHCATYMEYNGYDFVCNACTDGTQIIGP